MAECLFCKIAAGEISSEIVYQDDKVVAFKDIHPKAPVHVLIVPRKHIVSLAEIEKEDLPLVAHMIYAANRIAGEMGTGHGYKIVINTGEDGGQVIMHLHMHLLGGKKMPD
jgi:histidine triad (HIT) family protein